MIEWHRHYPCHYDICMKARVEVYSAVSAGWAELRLSNGLVAILSRAAAVSENLWTSTRKRETHYSMDEEKGQANTAQGAAMICTLQISAAWSPCPENLRLK